MKQRKLKAKIKQRNPEKKMALQLEKLYSKDLPLCHKKNVREGLFNKDGISDYGHSVLNEMNNKDLVQWIKAVEFYSLGKDSDGEEQDWADTYSLEKASIRLIPKYHNKSGWHFLALTDEDLEKRAQKKKTFLSEDKIKISSVEELVEELHKVHSTVVYERTQWDGIQIHNFEQYKSHLRVIGQRLNELDGMSLMSWVLGVAMNIHELGEFRSYRDFNKLVEVSWNGVGEWLL